MNFETNAVNIVKLVNFQIDNDIKFTEEQTQTILINMHLFEKFIQNVNIKVIDFNKILIVNAPAHAPARICGYNKLLNIVFIVEQANLSTLTSLNGIVLFKPYTANKIEEYDQTITFIQNNDIVRSTNLLVAQSFNPYIDLPANFTQSIITNFIKQFDDDEKIIKLMNPIHTITNQQVQAARFAHWIKSSN